MKSTSEAGKIQISEACKELLSPLYYVETRKTLLADGYGKPKQYKYKIITNTHFILVQI